MTKPLNKTIQPVPEDAQSHKGPGSTPSVPLDTTRGHRDDEKHNIREQAAHGNLVQNTSHRRPGGNVGGGKRSVPTSSIAASEVGTAQARLCPPYIATIAPSPSASPDRPRSSRA